MGGEPAKVRHRGGRLVRVREMVGVHRGGHR